MSKLHQWLAQVQASKSLPVRQPYAASSSPGNLPVHLTIIRVEQQDDVIRLFFEILKQHVTQQLCSSSGSLQSLHVVDPQFVNAPRDLLMVVPLPKK